MQQATFVKLSSNSRLAYFRYEAAPMVERSLTSSSMGMQLITGEITLVSGEKKGQLVEDGQVKPNQSVKLSFGTIQPNHYHALVTVNPEISKAGSVGVVTLVEPEDATDLEIILRTTVGINLHDLAWHVRVYLID